MTTTLSKPIDMLADDVPASKIPHICVVDNLVNAVDKELKSGASPAQVIQKLYELSQSTVQNTIEPDMLKYFLETGAVDKIIADHTKQPVNGKEYDKTIAEIMNKLPENIDREALATRVFASLTPGKEMALPR